MKELEKVNLKNKLSLFNEHWSPKIVGELNGQYIKLVKFKGDFVWHKHDNEDEMFFVIAGSFKMLLRDKTIELNEGECFIVPKGVEHKPVADEEAEVMLFEPKSVLNTGNINNELTKENLQKI
ncbi:MAG: cupin domain-containing protein [Ignavibacteria bacterium]|nr:cupin domain-containing protein [Ignavibacteria bacterium]MBT8381821.1 cupin domain-containing protein [Ignavibacteria bacterium]MBT8392497.1 cupin domain-containing protein [Ignavibacteria bacterium]NNJ53574.1 cupin domain-containing protein [Ignavibacteriaceae bacterium]NNL22076.1 cupin domain-containing protein [Ignavibacteriaceae bacterium]